MICFFFVFWLSLFSGFSRVLSGFYSKAFCGTFCQVTPEQGGLDWLGFLDLSLVLVEGRGEAAPKDRDTNRREAEEEAPKLWFW